MPTAAPGQVRIRVEAATVNPVDLATRSGALTEAGLLPVRDVIGIGWDVAGIVEETGPGVTQVEHGDRVIGLSDRLDVPLGTQAERVVLDADTVTVAPAGASPAEAATLPLNGTTAMQVLDRLDLKHGQTLLVTGAAGAVGGFATQLAVARGPRVVAVAGTGDEPLVRGLGAELFVSRVAETMPLHQVAAAHRRLAEGGLRGRLVLTL
jgi:NADPH2:quinone reductase